MTTNSLTSTRASLFTGLRQRIGGILEVIAESSDLRRSAREYERLSRLSDAELARRGVRRDLLAAYAFRRHTGL
ncbi:MAG TPA: DUF1127 domain-containing protein [Amaricoccus sp.]|nr:DUF1127 domain-containing protein [Amaricoccus sp.]